MPASARELLPFVAGLVRGTTLRMQWNGVVLLPRLESTARFAGVFLSCARFRKVTVVVFYIRVRSTVAKLAGDRWSARGSPGRLFFDDTLVFVAIMMFCHCSDGMICSGMPLYSRRFAVTGRQ